MTRHTPIRPWAVGAWLLLWQCASMVPVLNLLLPSPLLALQCLWRMGQTAAFYHTIVWSATRIFGGFLAATAAAALLAIPAYRFRAVREFLAPMVALMKTVPVASFIILALFWLRGDQLSFFISFLMVFPPVYLGVLTGIGQVDVELKEMARVYQVPLLRQVRFLYLPAMTPHFRSAVSLSLGLCWKAGVAAEVIGIPSGSLGEALYSSKVYFMMPELFAWTAVIVVVAMAVEKGFLALTDWALRKAGGR